MKNTILTIGLAFAFAMPFAGTADAYGERWYMVKGDTTVESEDGRQDYCQVRKGDRLERKSPNVYKSRIYVRIVGDWKRWLCKGWVRISEVYNMDTTIHNLDVYSNVTVGWKKVPVFYKSHHVWDSRDWVRDKGYDPRRRSVVCSLDVGTKVHVFHDYFNGSAQIYVVDGPCAGKRGWILSYTLDRYKAPR